MSSLSPSLLAVPALATVLALIWISQRVWRHAVGAGWVMPHIARPVVVARMVVLQALPIDARRRLHLVACDGGSVVLLTGGPVDLVVGWLPVDKAS
jgi:flagellar protein FliO/FliZ